MQHNYLVKSHINNPVDKIVSVVRKSTYYII